MGEIITWKEAQRRHPHDPNDPNHTFYFHVDENRVIDATHGGNSSRWINHSCDPNCEADEEDGRVFIKALRNIRAGEELNYDYGLIIDERYTHEAQGRVSLLVRRQALPRHAARAQATGSGMGPVIWPSGTPSGRRIEPHCCRASRSRSCPRSTPPTAS